MGEHLLNCQLASMLAIKTHLLILWWLAVETLASCSKKTNQHSTRRPPRNVATESKKLIEWTDKSIRRGTQTNGTKITVIIHEYLLLIGEAHKQCVAKPKQPRSMGI